jgi:hypothetical protein
MRRWLSLMSLFIFSSALSQPPGWDTFPDDATPLEPAALKARINGKTFDFRTWDGIKFQLYFAGSGYMFVTAKLPESTKSAQWSSTWQVEGSRVCMTRLNSSGCVDVRENGGILLWKRQVGGEVVKLVPE